MDQPRGPRVGVLVIAAAVIGVGLLIVPPGYSSDINRVSLSCGAPLFFDEDAVSREARQQDVSHDTALLIGAECHERITGRIAGAVLAGLVAVGTLGVASVVRSRTAPPT